MPSQSSRTGCGTSGRGTRIKARRCHRATELPSVHPVANGDIPEMDVHLIENDYFPVGAGEPALSVVAPAIAKAVGARVRGLPITPARVKDALTYL